MFDLLFCLSSNFELHSVDFSLDLYCTQYSPDSLLLGGVGGLTTALCMLKRGFDVTVFDRRATGGELSAALRIARCDARARLEGRDEDEEAAACRRDARGGERAARVTGRENASGPSRRAAGVGSGRLSIQSSFSVNVSASENKRAVWILSRKKRPTTTVAIPETALARDISIGISRENDSSSSVL